MKSTFDQVADIVADNCNYFRNLMTADSHIMDDLAIDSLEFLDTVYALDKHFGVKIPIEGFAHDNNWTLGTLAGMVDEQLEKKAAAALHTEGL